MNIRIKCNKCGTELETPFADGNPLSEIIIKVLPCPKCGRPENCHVDCWDIKAKEMELATFREQVAKMENEMSVLKNNQRKVKI